MRPRSTWTARGSPPPQWQKRRPIRSRPDLQTGEYFELAPAEITGAQIAKATAETIPGTNEWAVLLELDPEGTEAFADVTGRLLAFGASDSRNRFTIVLNGWVVSAPTTQAQITDGKPMIAGNLDPDSAKRLAAQLAP